MTYVGFDKLKGQLANRPGVTNPGGLAATIARSKYGASEVAKYAAKGKSMRHAPKKRKARKRH